MELSTIQEVENTTVVNINKVLYSGNVVVTGGRNGEAKSSDGKLDIELTSPGSKGNGTNPEQLLAAGWSACFIGAMHLASAKIGITLPAGLSVNTSVDLATNDDGFFLQAHLQILLPGLAIDQARKVVETAHATCPYSKATRGNINVKIDVVV
ncbi:Ohr subfamily peroxiredoxin [Chryseobacterium bernardetii]|uniref:Ohr subfamily peroxiredoxin n=2 Tax=Chryseobacterium TaxID=59732 RepID=A0A543EKJ0_9FLAO|nr:MULTISPECIES: organic hydroperoxide resistance protein [Chryseobacterium]MDR6372103.1 Ohr subfamily peroxiredoxin [Chryseobacterium vietnamense]MDR6442514.1 Ohr subfamily peroxiredoxin [Chryseobacterium bernardetii]TQM22104.1 Ohr subfamily peroxiredoxin [Chryseobacterium aquifrigidense]